MKKYSDTFILNPGVPFQGFLRGVGKVGLRSCKNVIAFDLSLRITKGIGD